MKYLVTGGAGFIGSNIVEELVKQGHQVRTLDNYTTGKRENLDPFRGKIEMIEGDVRSPFAVMEAVQGCDYVLHQAALPSVPRSVKDPLTTNEVGVVGTLNVLKAAINCGVKKVVFASSSSIYGNSEVLPKQEDMKPQPLSPYAVSKMAGEHYCETFANLYGLPVVALRYFNVFGPRQDPASQYSAVIPLFINAIKNNRQPVVYGDGLQSRDFCYVSNVVRANLAACVVDTGKFFVANVATGNRFTLNEMIAMMNRIMGKDIKPVYEKPRLGDVMHSLATVERLKEVLGVKELVGLEEGMERLCGKPV